MPRPLKPPELRQRRNQATSRAKLRVGGVRAPALPLRGCGCGGPPPEPKRRKGAGRRPRPRPPCETCGGTGVIPWHPQTKATWAIYWASPMASQWLEADLPGLMRLIFLVEDFWRCASAQGRKDAASEIRLQEQKFGLSPLDRRRLEWSIEEPDEKPESPPAPQPTGTDARSILRAVK